MTRAIIFDLDGVIVTTDDCHYQSWKRVADEENIHFDRELNERLRGVSRMESLNIILEKSKRAYSPRQKQVLAGRKNSYYREVLKKLTSDNILPGVLKILKALKKQGGKIGIGSSSKNGMLILRQLRLNIYFDIIVDGNDIKHSKPNPEVFLLAATKMKVKPQNCLVVEDADAGIAAAKAAGMFVMGIGLAANNPDADYAVKNLCDSNANRILSAWIAGIRLS